MSKQWIFFFGDGKAEGDPTRKDILGGKAASLAAMTAAGLPVPAGFTICIEACKFYHDNGGRWPEGLEDQLHAYMARLEKSTGRPFGKGSRPLLVSVRSGAAVSMPGMMDTLLNCGLHPALAAELDDDSRFWPAYAQFILQFGKTVADMTEASFEALDHDASGKAVPPKALCTLYMEHYRKATGRPFPATAWDALVQCVNAVFDSWNNERALVYRKKQDIRGVEGTAVTVQSMFPSEVSGIAFTANPGNPLAGEILIESSYGLGEAIVSGMVSPDLFVLDRDSLAIKTRTLGKKAFAVTSLEKASGKAPTDEMAFSLDDEQVLKIAKLALQLEKHFGYEVDIEWGISDGKISLLQSRKVKGLDEAKDIEVGRCEEVNRLKSLAADKRKVWVAHNLAETLAAPTPLTWDIMRRFMSGEGGFGKMYQDFGYNPSADVRQGGFLELICGRIYADTDRAAELFWANMPLEYNLDEVVDDPAVIEMAPNKLNANKADGTFILRLPRLVGTIIKASRRMKKARANALEIFNKQILPPYLDYLRSKRQMNLAELPTSAVLADLDQRIERIMTDFGKESLKPGFFGGASRAELEGVLTQLMGVELARQLIGSLVSGLSGDSTVEQNIMLYQVARGQGTLAEFIERFGHRTVGEMELSQPRWREDSSYLNTMLQNYRGASAHNPEEMHTANHARRQATEKELPAKLAEWGGSSLREQIVELMGEAQTLLPYREIGKHYLMMGYELIRASIMELSRRWNLGQDVFFLQLDELVHFESSRESMMERIKARKVRWQSAQRLLPAGVIDSNDLDRLGIPSELKDARQLTASPLAPGVVEGSVKIVFSPAEAQDLGNDCVLVCPSTDPGWTALFINIRGLVVERGGVLSHGAITARDFGIPAVACPDATRLLKNAGRIRVDGGKGQVTVLDEVANA